MLIPKELRAYFSKDSFLNYPMIDIPQQFSDKRGLILNLAGGRIGDVAFIKSKKNSIRANHYHINDWHICYLISGEASYYWSNNLLKYEKKEVNKIKVSSGQMIFTPKQTAHKFVFLKNTEFITIAKQSRKSRFYDKDTIKVVLENF